ncbi:hypothetical protein E6B08_25935 [Pseudomonas putida]|uniref:Uncharacterized protein n=1 Tax=Pseudomonas putida TaxID=303 RepID=A0A4D6XP57_PSEPU|nr:hypothetical protein E6B08_25935 [Pseudomonas putida]
MKEAPALLFADFVKFRPTAIPGGPPSAFSAPNGLGLKYRPFAYETKSTANTLEARILQSDPGRSEYGRTLLTPGRTTCWLPKHKLH